VAADVDSISKNGNVVSAQVAIVATVLRTELGRFIEVKACGAGSVPAEAAVDWAVLVALTGVALAITAAARAILRALYRVFTGLTDMVPTGEQFAILGTNGRTFPPLTRAVAACEVAVLQAEFCMVHIVFETLATLANFVST